MNPMSVPSKPYWRPCDQCGNEFRVMPGYVRKAIKNGCNPPRFCSRDCRDKSYVGEGNPKWRGGRLLSASGYVLVYAPDHPHQCKGYVQEHRLVMESYIGRILDPSECVHHINHDRLDNRLENLELMKSWADHRRRHGYYEPRDCANCGKQIMVSRARRRRAKRSFCSVQCSAAFGSRANAERAARRKGLAS